jgi:Flp pilus assembly protein TadG
MRLVWLRLKNCEKAAAALEFALSIPVIISAIIGMMEIVGVMAATTMMEGGLREAARYGITGAGASTADRQAKIIQIVSNHSQGMLVPANLSVTEKVYPSFAMIGDELYTDTNHNGHYDPGEPFTDRNGNGQWDADNGTPGVGNANDIVVYRVTYHWTYLTGFMNHVLGEYTDLKASITVRNEPY